MGEGRREGIKKKKKKTWNLEQHNYTLPTCLSPYIKGQLKKTLHKEILQ